MSASTPPTNRRVPAPSSSPSSSNSKQAQCMPFGLCPAIAVCALLAIKSRSATYRKRSSSPHYWQLPARRPSCASNRYRSSIRVFLLSAFPETRHSFFLFPIFFGLTARVIPLRSGLRVFCFVGSALKNAGFPPTMQTLACDSAPPSLSVVPQIKRGRKKGKRKCPISTL